MESTKTKTYQYRCKDKSIITPYFRYYCVKPVHRYLPWFIPANIVTIISVAFVFLSLFYVLVIDTVSNSSSYVLIPIFLFLYAFGDHLDGMQAKRTGTSSALGEFCDHYLDIFATGIIAGIFMILLEVKHPLIVGTTFFAVYLLHSVTIYEEYMTGWLHYEKIGSLEGLFLTIGMIALSNNSAFYELLVTNNMYGLTVIEWVLLCFNASAVISSVMILKRVKKITLKFILYILMFWLLLFSLYARPVTDYIWIVVPFNVYYISGLMRGHLVNGKEPVSDFLVPVMAFYTTLFLPESLNFDVYFVLAAIYLGIISLGSGLIIFYHLKEHWVWFNPKPANE